MDHLVQLTARVYRSKIAYILRHTLRVMFPIILLGSFAAVLRFTFFSPSGYISTMDISQLVWLTENTFYENVGGIFLRKKYNQFLKRKIFDWRNHNKFVLAF